MFTTVRIIQKQGMSETLLPIVRRSFFSISCLPGECKQFKLNTMLIRFSSLLQCCGRSQQVQLYYQINNFPGNPMLSFMDGRYFPTKRIT
jgi:hypothetical protein